MCLNLRKSWHLAPFNSRDSDGDSIRTSQAAQLPPVFRVGGPCPPYSREQAKAYQMKIRHTVTTAIAAYALALAALTLLAPTTALARKGAAERLIERGYAALTAEAPVTLPATGELEVAFSPHGGCTALVVKVINSAQHSIRVLAYSFTSAPIAKALVDAHKRGVDVQVVVDKSQKSARYTSATFLANAGIPVRIDFKHAIAHNKVIIVDSKTVEQGSFNYTRAAENSNAENVLVNWDNPKLAEVYLQDWEKHWEHSELVVARY